MSIPPRIDGRLRRDKLPTLPRGIQRPHVENVIALHLAQQFQTLQTGRLVEIRRDGAGLGTRSEQIVLSLDLCERRHESAASILQSITANWVDSFENRGLPRDVIEGTHLRRTRSCRACRACCQLRPG